MVTYVILVTSGLGEAIIKQANAIISILIGNVSIGVAPLSSLDVVA